MMFYKDARWLKDRLQSMGPAEAISRFADVGRHVALRASLTNFQSRPNKRFQPTIGSHAAPEIQNQLDSVSTKARNTIIALANHWVDHRATFFSLNAVPLGEPIDWHRDYSSGKVGPVKYSGLINAGDKQSVGNVKYIWELNRLQHLVLFALARLWTGNAKYCAEIERQVISWKKSNPFMMGVNWKSPLEAGLRLISWAYVYFLATGWKQDITAYDKLFGETVYHHQYFIRKFYSKHSSANNHLIGEMAGLYVASVFWPRYQESASWRSFARHKLIEEIARQVEPDGVACERATEYQIFVLELFILAGALGQAIGDPFPQEYWERINRAILFLSVISNSSGDLPMFGDGDSAQVIAIPGQFQERSRALFRIRQCYEGTGSPDLRSVLLLWGQTPKKFPLWSQSSSRREKVALKFSDGGYYVLASDRGHEDEVVVVFDVGALGLPPLSAHGHADALSFCLSYGGHEFLIDPGTYCYQGMNQWRAYFRGTGAHNTLRIDGEDQSVAGGPFLWRHAAHCRIEHIDDRAEFVEVCGAHDGYCRLRDPVIHIRRLRLIKKTRVLTIVDRLECGKFHEIELLFHFSERCQVQQVGAHSFEASNQDKRISIHVDPRLRLELYRGCETPIFGWVSRIFDVKEPSFTLVARASVDGTTQFATEIVAL